MTSNESHGLELLDRARAALSRLQANVSTGVSTVSEHQAAQETARSAMDWLEDTSMFSEAHLVLDQIGALTREYRPEACVMEHDKGTFFDTCSVSLAHSRVGLSPGFVVEEMSCSICDADPRDCEHLSGETYDGAIAHLIVKKATLLEVSIVTRPVHPDARITRMSVPRADERAALGHDVPPSAKVVCDKCLSACRGVRDHAS